MMDGEMTMEQYLKQEIENGYIDDKYAPIKCYCGCSDFTDVKQQYEEHMLVEKYENGIALIGNIDNPIAAD